jgi:N-acetylglutamate synthase-like GNAT family acetyltransferase
MHDDPVLARRLERAEGTVSASYVDARRRLTDVAAEARDFEGTIAIFDGVDSPLTQTFGLGLAGAPPLDGIEAFFTARGAPVMHEVSPYAGVETIAALVGRGYVPIELSTIFVQSIADRAPSAGARLVTPADHAAFVDASVAGWSEDPAVARIIRALVEVGLANRAMRHYVVERDGRVVATGSMGIHDGVALLAGASTIPSARGSGAQSQLLATRLGDARQLGCELAMIVTAVGSASQRNAERNGFRIAYTRTKWRLATRRDGAM